MRNLEVSAVSAGHFLLVSAPPRKCPRLEGYQYVIVYGVNRTWGSILFNDPIGIWGHNWVTFFP